MATLFPPTWTPSPSSCNQYPAHPLMVVRSSFGVFWSCPFSAQELSLCREPPALRRVGVIPLATESMENISGTGHMSLSPILHTSWTSNLGNSKALDLAESPWIKSWLKPGAMLQGRVRSGDGSFLGVDQLASTRECSRHQSGCSGSTPPLTSDFGNRLAVPCGTLWDVKTLCKEGQLKEAIDALDVMDNQRIKASSHTYVCLLQVCINMKALKEGKQVHAHILKSGFKSNIFLGNHLIIMYSKCGSLLDAQEVFDKMLGRNVFTWTIMIAAYAQCGHAEEAFKLFHQMKRERVKPDKVTFLTLLKACTNLAALEEGKRIHAHIIKSGFGSDVVVGSTLVDMYAKCGSIKHARQVFDRMGNRNVVSWNAMMSGYTQHGHSEQALKLYWQMLGEGVKPDEVTYSSILKACASLAALDQGKQIHACIIKSGFELDLFVGSALVDMYGKCGSIDYARRLFDKMPKQDVVLWNAMIAGYAEHGRGVEAFELFRQMEGQGMKPNEVTFVTILKACASLAALEQGKQIHAQIIRSGFESGAFVGNTLVDMYAKCGSIEDARQVFDTMPKRSVVSWNVMIAGYAQHGHSKDALELVEQMQQEGMELDEFTFVSMFSACSHAGLVSKGRDYFESMSRDHGITPTVEHYACVVDLLGRAGHLDEAEDFIKRMPFPPSAIVWITLLAACRTYGNVELAERATEHILKLEPSNASAYVLLSTIYSVTGRWDEIMEVRKMMEETGLKK